VSARLPPPLATWLLERLGAVTSVDALIGDLTEQFSAGRSRVWYWRQTTAALGLGFFQTLRTHGLSFIAAVLAGCAFNALWLLGSAHVFGPYFANLSPVRAHPWTTEGIEHLAGMQVSAMSNTVLTCLSVWLVTRVHRAHRRAALLVFVLALTAQHVPDIARLVIDANSHSVAAITWAAVLVPTGLQGTFTLAVGLWAIRGERFADMDLRRRLIVIIMALQASIVAFIYHARLIGALPLSRPQWYVLDALDIAGVAYVAALWWRPLRAARTTAIPEVQSGIGT
jgi:hypothetical protein